MKNNTFLPIEKDYFEGVIGQKRTKTELGFYLANHLATGAIIPHLLLTGSKGDGKTHLAKKFAKNLPDLSQPTKQNKAFYLLNASTILNPTIFLEDIMSKLQDQYATIFIDEAHELPKKVQMILLTILEPNKRNCTSYTFNDVDYRFDFSKLTFIFATTEDDKIFHALKDRLVTIALEPYDEKDLSQIIELVIDGEMTFEDGVLQEMSHYVRRNARSADRMAKNALAFHSPVFTREHLSILKEKLNLFPFGISHNEIRALRLLESDGECSLGHLSCRMAQTAKSVQKEVEPYPIALGLMEIDGKRRITAKGRQFLKEIHEEVKAQNDLVEQLI